MRIYQKLQKLLLLRLREGESNPRLIDFKQQQLSNLSGTVVEIGPGAGTNLKYFPKGINWIGVEPNAEVNQVLQKEAQRVGISNVRILNNPGEKIELPDNSADFVVLTLVLCSVDNPEQVLSEVYRILKPGGKYIFIEHVAAPRKTLKRFAQEIFNPLSRVFAGNCHANRETLKEIQATGFSDVVVNMENIRWGYISQPSIYGFATK